MSIKVSWSRIMIICIFLMIYKMFFILPESNPIMNLCSVYSQMGVIIFSLIGLAFGLSGGIELFGKRDLYGNIVLNRY